MDKIRNIFIEINKQINYIVLDCEFIFSKNYLNCLEEIYIVLKNTLYKLQDIYYKYILYPKLKKI